MFARSSLNALSQTKLLIGLTQKNSGKNIDEIDTWSQSYQNLISLFLRFLLLSLSVCSIRKYCLCFKMAKLNSGKRKKSLFYEEKSLVGLTPRVNFINILCAAFLYESFTQRFFVLKVKV
jgi:hypothetical protein